MIMIGAPKQTAIIKKVKISARRLAVFVAILAVMTICKLVRQSIANTATVTDLNARKRADFAMTRK